MSEVTISKEKYDDLIKRSNKLEALEQAGVDNWSGYGEAMDLLQEFNDTSDSEYAKGDSDEQVQNSFSFRKIVE